MVTKRRRTSQTLQLILHPGLTSHTPRRGAFCNLPLDEGEGTTFTFSVYYDATEDKCKPFIYKGAGGNANRFENERQCVRNCSARAEDVYPMDAFCNLPLDEGEGTSFIFSVYYDATEDKCKPFIYKGAGGNANRFEDERQCMRNCSARAEDVYPMDAFCNLPLDEGEGTSFIFSVYYDATEDKCKPFIYKGAGGNANRFEDERQCMRNCSARAEDVYPMDETKACHFRKNSGECNGQCLRYYYDPVDAKCKKFLWTGCLGNGNRFFDQESCNATCAGIHAFCNLPLDEGEGTTFTFSVYYDATEDKCNPFLYKGAGGNANRFENERQCMRNCSARAEDIYPMDETKACHLRKDIGKCGGNHLMYYYDSVHDKCKKLLWTGCGGNGNRFVDQASCNATCAGIHDDRDEAEEDEPDTPVAIICGVLLGIIGAIIIIVVVVLTVKSK
ncbi:actinia tenebrosa protease inhibitors [Centroberyx affinis]|uniref:actinia tenebrosa protease inhibitors n=1 Tax=Centroberyx affinis TaxID=166261 RepID=UPI003A5C52F6